jgi:acetolactate synthase-1/2/3 large subunit
MTSSTAVTDLPPDASAAATVRVSDVVADALGLAGTTHLFGLSGSTMLAVLDSVTSRTDVKYVSVRHEQCAASMADGVGRITGRPGVLITHSGPAVINTAMAVACAYKDSVPLVALSTTESQAMLGRESWHEVDTHAMFKPIVKWSAKVERPEQIARVLRNAFQIAISGRPGPVQVEIPDNVSSAQVDASILRELHGLEGLGRTPRFRPLPPPDLVSEAADLLRGAERPLVFVGGGAAWSDAAAEVTRLVEALGAPVVTTYQGRGVVADRHPQNLSYVVRGHLAPWLGGYVAFDAVREADVILALGARLSDISTRNWTAISPDATIVQVDIDDRQIGFQYPVSLGIQSDIAAFATALATELEQGDDAAGRFRGRTAEKRQALEAELAAYFDYDRGRPQIQAQQVIEDLLPVVDDDTILVFGSGRHTHHGNKLPVQQPHRYINSVALGTMGQAFPAAIGAKMAAPDKRVLCLVGDGEYGMVMAELETAVREGVDVTTVVFNDFGYGAVKMWQAHAYDGRVAGVDHTNPDFGAVAEQFGARGYTVGRPEELRSVLQAAVEDGAPSVVDVRVDRETYQVR